MTSIYVVLLLVCSAGAAQAANSCASPQGVDALASQVAAGLNANRQALGLRQLRFNAALGSAAMSHACDMSVNEFFSHNGSDGSSVRGRARLQGYRTCLVAENIAWGYPNPSQIVSGWMNSAGHRRNMLNPQVTEFGIGITNGAQGPNWVLVLADDCA